MKCCQCGRLAVVQYQNGLLFCVDCNLKYQQAMEINNSALERQMNFLMDEIDSTFGIGPTGGRFPNRTPNIYTGNINFKPITLNGSVVGSINQGTINGLNVNLSNISVGNPDLAQKLKEFTEGVINDTNLKDDAKNESIENLKFLSEQANNPNKNSTVIKTIVMSIAKVVEVSANLATLWVALSPYFIK